MLKESRRNVKVGVCGVTGSDRITNECGSLGATLPEKIE